MRVAYGRSSVRENERVSGEAEEPAGPGGRTVGRAAALVGVSVKTLHHWDAIGLVRPGGRTWAGYRVYSADDIARVHRVLVYRELGFPLAEIARLLDDPAVDARAHLRRQRSDLADRIARLQDMVRAVDRMMAATRDGIRLTAEEQAEIFGSDWRPEWIDEAEERWGGSDQWAQYAERAAAMTPGDWREVSSRTHALNADLAAAKAAGVRPGDETANELADRHRAMVSTYFDCTYEMHACMSRMFRTDPRYTKGYPSTDPDFLPWLAEVIAENARSHGVDPETATWG